MDFSRELFKEGVLGTGIAFPTVPEGKARIRTIMTATHTKEELEQALEVLRSEEHTSELQSPCNLVCRLLLEKKKNHTKHSGPYQRHGHGSSLVLLFITNSLPYS